MSEIKVKLVLAGPPSVGKTSLIDQYIDNKFEAGTKTTIGVDIKTKDMEINIDGDITNLTLAIWDFGGQERFAFLMDKFVKGARGALMVVDLTAKETLRKSEFWYDLCMEENSNMPIILLANKLDLKEIREIDDQDLQNFVSEHENIITSYKTSAKTGDNVEKSFEEIAKQMYLKI